MSIQGSDRGDPAASGSSRDPGPARSGAGSGPWQRLVDRLSVGDATVDRVPLGDVLLAVALLVPALVAHALRTTDGTPLVSPSGIAGWVLLVLAFGSLAWRRVTPSLTMLVAGLSTGAWFLIGQPESFVPLAVMMALYSTAAHGSRADGVIALVITEVFVVVSFASIMAREAQFSGVQLAVNLLMFLGLWALGDRTRVRRELLAELRGRAEQAERSRELTTELAVAEERSRIARELHDVVAHTVSVMVVQAGAGRRASAADPSHAAEALAAIEDVGRGALADLRRMVGVLREEPDAQQLAPQPTLADLPELVERLGQAGLPVRIEREGEPRELPSGIEVSAYRIVQEALTNVIKHAGAVREVVVRLRYDTAALVVEVEDDGRGAASNRGTSAEGSGLLGMRERVAIFDGRLQVGPRRSGGYRVRAEIPHPAQRERPRRAPASTDDAARDVLQVEP